MDIFDDPSVRTAKTLGKKLRAIIALLQMAQFKATSFAGLNPRLTGYGTDENGDPDDESLEDYPRLNTGWAIPDGARVLVALSNGKRVVLADVVDGVAPEMLTGYAPMTMLAGSRIVDDLGSSINFATKQVLVNHGDDTVSVVGFPAADVSLDGTLANSDDGLGSWIRYTTAATLGADAGLVTDFGLVRRGWSPTMIGRLRTPTTMTNIRLWFGFSGASLDTSSSPNTEIMAFRYDSALDGGAWQALTKSGGTQHTVAGPAIAADTVYRLEVRSRGGGVTFVVNDETVAEMTADLPSSSAALGLSVRVSALSASARSVELGRIELLHR